jgi:hypothetical protein
VDIPDLADAQAKGYKEAVTDRGAAASGASRFSLLLEKMLNGGSASGFPFRAVGEGPTQAAAEARALEVLNANRRARYGGSPGRISEDSMASFDPRAPDLSTMVDTS